MAEVDDRWHRTVTSIVDGKTVQTKERTKAYGTSAKRWRARWRDENNKQCQLSFAKEKDAIRHAATVEADMLRRTYIDPDAGKVTFKTYAEKWRAGRVHRDSTRALVESQLRRHVYPVFGDRQIGSIKPSEAQAWVRGMEIGRDKREPLMPATVQVICSFVAAIASAAVADKLIVESPFTKLRRTRPSRKRVIPPTGEQVAAAAAAMPPRFRALVAVGAGVGLRQGEAFGLELDCVDFLRRQLTVRQQMVDLTGTPPFLGPLKTAQSARVVPLADAVLAALAEHVREFPPQEVEIEDRTNPAKPVRRKALLLFSRPDGGPLWRSKFSGDIWQPVRTAAKLPAGFTFHDFRHYFASALIRFGESVKTVQVRLGHANATETLNTYSHLWPDSEDRTRDAIDDAFASDVGGMWATKPKAARRSS